MAKQLIIGLCGLAGSGKSTAARILTSEHTFVRKPFAYPLKAMVAALGVPASVLDGSTEGKSIPRVELAGHTVRHALQTLGTEWGRQHMGEDFWVKLWARGAVAIPRVVADDVRFENEAQTIKAMGGLIIKLTRSGSGLSGSAGAHASENIVRIPHDCAIANDGSPEELAEKLSDAVFGFEYAASDRNPRSPSRELDYVR